MPAYPTGPKRKQQLLKLPAAWTASLAPVKQLFRGVQEAVQLLTVESKTSASKDSNRHDHIPSSSTDYPGRISSSSPSSSATKMNNGGSASTQLEHGHHQPPSNWRDSSDHSYTAASLNWSDPHLWQLPNGDRLPDFSVVGCNGAVMNAAKNVAVDHADSKTGSIPTITLNPAGNGRDQTAELQQCINEAARYPLHDKLGIRALVQLTAGTFVIASDEGLKLHASGVILRGAVDAQGQPLTRFVCTGRRGHGSTLFTIRGEPCRDRDHPSKRIAVSAERVPVGATVLPLAKVDGLQVGDCIAVVRIGNHEWIRAIGMDTIPSRPGATATTGWTPFNLVSHRVITSIDQVKRTVTLDAALTTAMEQRFGGGYIWRYDGTHRIRHVGIEHLRVECQLLDDASWTEHKGIHACEDEQHMEYAVQVDLAQDCWLRNVHATRFGFHTVVGAGSKNISILDCSYMEPAGKVTGAKRYGFNIAGQLSLVARCVSSKARHAFAVDARSCGPNVYWRCRSSEDMGSSETHHRWGNGVLYDQVDAPIAIQNRLWMGSGHGWSGANCIVWNCASRCVVQSPPTAWNFCVSVSLSDDQPSRKQHRQVRDRAAFPQFNTDAQSYVEISLTGSGRSLSRQHKVQQSLYQWQCGGGVRS